MNPAAQKIATAGACLLLATLSAAIFSLAALAAGRYTQTDIAIGAAWTFTLSLIISSPILIPVLRRRLSPKSR